MLGGGVASLEEDEVEEEVQELGHAETYNEYMPVKCKTNNQILRVICFSSRIYICSFLAMRKFVELDGRSKTLK